MEVEAKQGALVQPPEENLEEYRGKDSIKKKSGPYKRPKTTTTTKATKGKAIKATKTDAGDMIHHFDMPMVDDFIADGINDNFIADGINDKKTTATTAPSQPDIKPSDSASGISLMSQSNKDENTLVEALKRIQSSNGSALVVAFMIYDVCRLFTKDFASGHIIAHKCNALINGLIKALNHIGTLPIDSVVGLITASFVLGQSCWVSCVNELLKINASLRDDAIAKFGLYLNL